MSYESPRKIFRDMNKNPDYYIDPQEKSFISEEKGMSVFDEKSNRESKFGNKEGKEGIEPVTLLGKKFKNTVDNVFEAGLLDGVNDKEELVIVKHRQEVVLNYLNQILEDIKNYLSQIGSGQLQKMSSYDDIKKYQDDIRLSDEIRRAYHNRLIGDIKIASRLININFNADFSNDLRIQEESKMSDRKELSIEDLKDKMAKRKYFKFDFPSGSFIDLTKVPKDPQGEREYIANWAFMIYSDLSLLQKEVVGIVNEIKKEIN